MDMGTLPLEMLAESGEVSSIEWDAPDSADSQSVLMGKIQLDTVRGHGCDCAPARLLAPSKWLCNQQILSECQTWF